MRAVKFVPFWVVWPVIQLLAPYIIKLVIPLILQKVREADEKGDMVTISDDEIAKFLKRHESHLKAVYQK
jgi:hypothetical protein